jgi:hypothetical protein
MAQLASYAVFGQAIRGLPKRKRPLTWSGAHWAEQSEMPWWLLKVTCS